MPSEVTRSEFDHLVTRVSVVEREVEGEKMVTRHVLEQSRRNGDDLAALKTRLGRVEQKVDGLTVEMADLKNEMADLKKSLPKMVGDVMKKDLPVIVGDVMREVFREHDSKR
jgi:uncharacterized protein YoxC